MEEVEIFTLSIPSTRTLIVPSIVTVLGKWNWWPFSIKSNI